MRKRLTAIALSAALLVSLAACKPSGTEAAARFSVWGLPSTVKVMQDDVGYAGKRPAELVYDGVAGEYESYQLMLTAETDIDEYALGTADLTGAAGTFSRDNFTVYNEYYVEVTLTSTTAQRPGFYPDGLIPADLSAAAGENKVAAGCNQGIWVTVHIPQDAAPGEYSGTFTLTADGQTVGIPVTLTVRDYVLTEDAELRTLFVTREKRMLESEFDSSLAMKEAYYEFFLDYRINLNYLPIDTEEPAEMVAAAQKYANDARVNTYALPANATGGEWRDMNNWPVWLRALAENSTPESDLLKKLVWYYVDEPEGMYGQEAGTAWALNELSTVKSMIRGIYDEIAADGTGRYDGLKAIDGWEDYFLDPPTVVTLSTSSDDRLKAETSIWSPGWGNLTQARDRDYWMAIAEQAYAAGTLQEFWWYGCMGPKYPYPTYHIDDNLLSSRVVAWLQQTYGITGNLYWSVETERDVYKVPYFSGQPGYDDTGSYPTGDGYLVYPGARYGHFGPLPSIRLMSVRDGAEEYELLMDLEHRYEELKTVYGASFDAGELVSRLYSRLADGLLTTRDADLFDDVRGELLDTVIEMSEAHGFLVDGYTVTDNVATVGFYVQDGYTVTYNGAALTPEGRRYTVEVDLTETPYLTVTLEKDGTTTEISRYLTKARTPLLTFDSGEMPEGVAVTGDAAVSKAELVQSGGGYALAVTLKSIETEFAAYQLRATIGKEAFLTDADFARVDEVSVKITNTAGFAYELRVWLSASGNERNYLTVTLQPGVNELSFSLVNDEWNRLSGVDEIAFEVDNDSANLTQYSMVIDDLEVTWRDDI